MTTPLQLAANRANAQLSTGPKTEAGKQRTRLNGLRHGLTGQIHPFAPEEHAAFEKHCQGIRESFAPVGVFELNLTQAIAEDQWRLSRARAIENGIFALAAGAGEADPGGDDPAGDDLSGAGGVEERAG